MRWPVGIAICLTVLTGCPPEDAEPEKTPAQSPEDTKSGEDPEPQPEPANEALAYRSLRVLNLSQSLFREGDKEGDGNFDYGTLQELLDARLVDDRHASGTREGYVFETNYSPTTSEFLWYATARPVEGLSGRSFFTNQRGTIWEVPAEHLEVDRNWCELQALADLDYSTPDEEWAKRRASLGITEAEAPPREILPEQMLPTPEAREAATVEALREISQRQSRFREGDSEDDGNLDYGSLQELVDEMGLDPTFLSGKHGYRFEVGYSPTTSEFLWYGTATSDEDGRSFFSNHRGVVFAVENGEALEFLDPNTCRLDRGIPSDDRDAYDKAYDARLEEFGVRPVGQ